MKCADKRRIFNYLTKQLVSVLLDHLDNGLHLDGSVGVVVWVLFVLVANVNVGVQALKDGQRGN